MSCIICNGPIPPDKKQDPTVPGPLCDKLTCRHAALDQVVGEDD